MSPVLRGSPDLIVRAVVRDGYTHGQSQYFPSGETQADESYPYVYGTPNSSSKKATQTHKVFSTSTVVLLLQTPQSQSGVLLPCVYWKLIFHIYYEAVAGLALSVQRQPSNVTHVTCKCRRARPERYKARTHTCCVSEGQGTWTIDRIGSDRIRANLGAIPSNPWSKRIWVCTLRCQGDKLVSIERLQCVFVCLMVRCVAALQH